MDLSRILRGGCHLWLSETWPTFSILSMKLTAKTSNSFQHTFPKRLSYSVSHGLPLQPAHLSPSFGHTSLRFRRQLICNKWDLLIRSLVPSPFKVQNGIFGIWKVTWSPRCAAQLPGITWNSGVTRQNFNGQSLDYMKRCAKKPLMLGICYFFEVISWRVFKSL